jgi:amino-acid N-acetyltransferase
MPRPFSVPPTTAPFEERDFYLEEFRGRSVLVAVSPELVGAPSLAPLADTIADLVRNDTRVLLWWPATKPSAERRLLAALGRARAIIRRRGPRRLPPPVLRAEVSTGTHALRAKLWERLKRARLCVLVVTGWEASLLPRAAAAVAVALGVPKLILVDPRGGLGEGTSRLSFVDESVLDTVLTTQGEAEWAGLAEQRDLLIAVREALGGGVEAVNLCTLEGVGEELFTYQGSGTLFTQDDYCRVGPLTLDQFAQAERLLERGQREGMLKLRTEEETAEVLASGFGATICGRNLAGIAGLLTEPYADARAGEIVGLYTITRFKGEGIGERLVARLIAEAASRGLTYVFAVAFDERAQQFFQRVGFARVRAGAVPAAKWAGYDTRRRGRIGVFRRRMGGQA